MSVRAAKVTDSGQNSARPRSLLGVRLLQCAPVLLPLIVLVGTGLRGLDFGLHWDERPWQIGPVKHMVQAHTFLPGYYNYPSFDYWLNLLVLAPDAAGSRIAGDNLREHLLYTLDSHAYLLRLRAAYLLITSLTLVWVYLLVLQRCGLWVQALFAASLLGCSWEVAYHLRWVATDGMLMQFAALTVLLASYAVKTGRESWLIAAAAVAGLACGTKYPGGLLVLPVALAAFFGAATGSARDKAVRLVKAGAVFALVCLATTPAAILQPAKFFSALLYETRHYATGHGGHTVGRGFEHAGRMLEYFSAVLFSPYLAIALPTFVLAVIGVSVAIARNWREGAVLLTFPVSYVLYFSTQQAMVVRNLLAVVPFLAVAASQGAGVVGEFIGRRGGAVRLLDASWLRIAWAGLLGAALCVDASWLISSASSIVVRHNDQFVRDAGQYLRTHSATKYFLSPRVRREMAMVEPTLNNLTADPAQAEVLVLYAREGMRRWHDWPANRRALTQACFGPREVNFNMYPNWWGDDRIIAISRRRAEQIHLHIAGVSPDAVPPETVLSPPPTHRSKQLAPISTDLLPKSWALPSIDPRLLVPHAEAEAVIGPLARGPASGGWELDGTACTYVGRDGLIVSVAIISTSAFDLERHDPQSVIILNDGVNAYAARVGPLGDVRLFSRTLESAVIVHVSGDSRPTKTSLDVAKQFASTALERLDVAQELSTLR